MKGGFIYEIKIVVTKSHANWNNVRSGSDGSIKFSGVESNDGKVLVLKPVITAKRLRLIFQGFQMDIKMEIYGCPSYRKDCLHLPESTHQIPGDDNGYILSCWQDWTLVAGKLNSNSSWNKNWTDFGKGFKTNDQLWLGNNFVSYLTNSDKYTSRLDIWSDDDSHIYMEYEDFNLGPENLNYIINSNKISSGFFINNFLKFNYVFYVPNNSSKSDCIMNSEAGSWWTYSKKCSAHSITGKNTALPPLKNVEKFIWRIIPAQISMK